MLGDLVFAADPLDRQSAHHKSSQQPQENLKTNQKGEPFMQANSIA